jgi:hypothetical protein
MFQGFKATHTYIIVLWIMSFEKNFPSSSLELKLMQKGPVKSSYKYEGLPKISENLLVIT